MAPFYPLGSPYSRHEHSGSVLRQLFILGTLGGGLCPMPHPRLRVMGRLYPTPGSSSSPQDRQGHSENWQELSRLGKDRWRKAAKQGRDQTPGWGSSQRADRLRGGRRGVETALLIRRSPLEHSRAGARRVVLAPLVDPTSKPSSP